MKKIGILALIVGAIIAVIGIVTKIVEHRALAIIGGADGPTAIFIAGKVGHPWHVGIVIGLIIVVVGLIMISRKK